MNNSLMQPDYSRVLLDQVLARCGMGINEPGASTAAMFTHAAEHVLGNRDKSLYFLTTLVATVERDMKVARLETAEAKARVRELEARFHVGNHAAEHARPVLTSVAAA